MTNLFEAFTEFLSNHPHLSNNEKGSVAVCLQNLLDADPEKEVMRRALEHYANAYNWPYRVQTVEGFSMLGMKSEEAVGFARDALEFGSVSLRSCLLSMYDEKTHQNANKLVCINEIKCTQDVLNMHGSSLKVYNY